LRGGRGEARGEQSEEMCIGVMGGSLNRNGLALHPTFMEVGYESFFRGLSLGWESVGCDTILLLKRISTGLCEGYDGVDAALPNKNFGCGHEKTETS